MPTADSTTVPPAGTQTTQAQSRSRMHPLWTHILQANPPPFSISSTPSSSDKLLLPPTAPIDKAGTSMRMLLHDTQAQFERFSERVVKLTDGVHGAKREISTMEKLFEREHERLVEEIVDLANRCQTQIQKSLGTPAQAPRVDEITQRLSAVDGRLTALDTKVDMLHMLNQTQSQALQTLQDQQSQLLTALTPILALLQSVPLHIDNAKHDVKDTISQCQQATSADLKALLSTHTRRRSNRDSELPPSSSAADVAPTSSPSDRLSRKRRKVGSALSNTRHSVYPSPRASASDSQLVFNTGTPAARATTPGSRVSAIDVKLVERLPVGPKHLTGPAYPPLRMVLQSLSTSAYLADAENCSPAQPAVDGSSTNSSRSPTPSVPFLAPPFALSRPGSVSPRQRDLDAAHKSPRSPLRIRSAVPQTSASSTPLRTSEKLADPLPLVLSGRGLPVKPLSLKDIRAQVGNGTKRFLPIDDEDEDDEMGME